MRKAGLHQVLLFCLCVCLGIFLTGCSGQDNQKDNIDQEENCSDSVEYQAEDEASDTGSEDLDSSMQLGRQQDLPESGTEASAEEVVMTDNLTVYDYASMENVLAAMVSAMQENGINRYYRDSSDNDLAVHYLYDYVNMFDYSTFEKVSMNGKTHSSYVRLEDNYLSDLLTYAFGDIITSENLEADGDLVLKKGNDCYVALEEIQPALVDYTGFENEGFTDATVFPFDYELYLDNGDTEDGIMQVRFQESDQVESGIILKIVAVSRY